MTRFVLTVQIRRGTGPKVREILREGPPFDLEETTLERHQVFLADDELVFVFEGSRAEEEARRLLSMPDVLGRASRIGAHINGPPRVLEEVFSWERPETLPGVSFGPYPGPGDSEGGPVE